MAVPERQSSPRGSNKQRGVAKAAPRTFPDPPRRILLVSTAAPIPAEVVRRTIELATPEHAKITVLGIARVFGTSLGFPHPGLQPTSSEWADQRKFADDAADLLRDRGFEVRVALSRSRNPPKMIARWGNGKNFHAIVIADPERPKWRRLIEGDITREIGRRCEIPVHAIPVPASHGSARAS